MSSEYGDDDVGVKAGEKKGRYCSLSADGKESCFTSTVVKLLVCIMLGVIFGIAMQKGHGR